MIKVAVITNPSYDMSTEYMESWSEKLILNQKTNKEIIFELKKDAVTKKNFIRVIMDENPKLLILNAHGDQTKIYGYKGEVILRSGEDKEILKDKIVHTLACASGHTLGPTAIEDGTVAYIGYKENFKAICFEHKTKHGQQSDPLAELSFVPAFSVISELLNGKTVGEAYKISREMYIKNLRKAIAHPDESFNQFAASRLYHNITHQVCLGDYSAKLY